MTQAVGRSLAIGIAASIFAVCTGTGWQVLIRAGVTSGLTPFDIALFRYGIPALLVLPILWRNGLLPEGSNPWLAGVLVAGSGLPFGLMVMSGATFAPVAHMGAIMPSSTPLMVAVMSVLLLGERLSRLRILGFLVVVAGIMMVVRQAFDVTWPGAWRGDLLFLGAAILWALSTIALRKLGLTPWHMVAVVSFWSGLGAIALWFANGAHDFSAVPRTALLLQLVWQGILAGFLAMYAYGLAVRHLGPTNATLWGAIMPGTVAFAGYVTLGEPVAMLTMAGIALTSLGMILASGALDRKAP
ncbi:MAG: DMT family transporter [Proteobacteria bacterium]|nr:DMT family transporter [Pseudomonadota bacterium]